MTLATYSRSCQSGNDGSAAGSVIGYADQCKPDIRPTSIYAYYLESRRVVQIDSSWRVTTRLPTIAIPGLDFRDIFYADI